LQRQGGNEAQANGRERTDTLHDHKGVVMRVSKADAVQASSLFKPKQPQLGQLNQVIPDTSKAHFHNLRTVQFEPFTRLHHVPI
jgi:hypothetical protein